MGSVDEQLWGHVRCLGAHRGDVYGAVVNVVNVPVVVSVKERAIEVDGVTRDERAFFHG